MLDVQGRAFLVKGVLTTIYIYIMMVLDLPAWMLNAFESTCRGFLGCGKALAKGGACPIFRMWLVFQLTWEAFVFAICTFLMMMLSMKWLWLSRVHADKPWYCADIHYSAKVRPIFQAEY